MDSHHDEGEDARLREILKTTYYSQQNCGEEEDHNSDESEDEDDGEDEDSEEDNARREREASWSKHVDDRNRQHEEKEREEEEQRVKNRAGAVAKLIAMKDAGVAATTGGDDGTIDKEVNAEDLWKVTDGILDADVDAILAVFGDDCRFTAAQVRDALIATNCDINAATCILVNRLERVFAASIIAPPAPKQPHSFTSFTSDEAKEELLCDEILDALSDNPGLLDAVFSQLRDSPDPFKMALAIRTTLPADLRQRSQGTLRAWAHREADAQKAQRERDEERKHEPALALMQLVPTSDQGGEIDVTKQYEENARRGARSIQCESTYDQATVYDGEPTNKRLLVDTHSEENNISARHEQGKSKREGKPSLKRQHPERSSQRNQRVRQRRKTEPGRIRTRKRKRRNCVTVEPTQLQLPHKSTRSRHVAGRHRRVSTTYT